MMSPLSIMDNTPVKIVGYTKTQSGNMLIFGLDRVSGELSFTLHYLDGQPRLSPEPFIQAELRCSASSKPKF
jgi:hypothetical protein